MNLSRVLITTCLLLILNGFVIAQEVSILSWNIANLGKTKSEVEIEFMAAEHLNRTGSKWDYRVSDPTTGTSQQKERYAFIWKTSVVKLKGRPWLDKTLAPIVCREPYLARFSIGENVLLLANYHSIPHAKKPQWENEQVLNLPQLYLNDKILIAGDYNINSTDKYWDLLDSRDLRHLPIGGKTTLRRACTTNNNFTYTNHAIDFFIYENRELLVTDPGVVDFVLACENLEMARGISDHLPAFCTIRFKN